MSCKSQKCACSALIKQQERQTELRRHNIEALKEYIRNAKLIAALGVGLLLLPLGLGYALWCGFSAFNVAVLGCIFAGIFSILVALLSSHRASDLQTFSDILERMGSDVNEDLHQF